MTLQGKLLEIFETKHITDKFQKREFIVEYAENANYPQTIAMEMQQDKCEILDSYKTGDLVEVEFNLNGRKWINPAGENKYFNTLVCWKIQKLKDTEVFTGMDELAQDDSDLPF